MIYSPENSLPNPEEEEQKNKRESAIEKSGSKRKKIKKLVRDAENEMDSIVDRADADWKRRN